MSTRFAVVHDAGDGSELLVNLCFAVSIRGSKRGTLIVLSDGAELEVRESVRELLESSESTYVTQLRMRENKANAPELRHVGMSLRAGSDPETASFRK